MNDLSYRAKLNNSLGRTQEALDCFEQLIREKADLAMEDRNLLSNIIKTAVDPTRQSIRVLNEAIVDERLAGNAKNVEILTGIKDKCEKEVQETCQAGLKMIEGEPLSNTEDMGTKIHLQKIRGDLYRYIVEAKPDSESAIKNAKDAYTFAYEKSLTDLPPCSPITLGVALNFAVFKYEHLRCLEDAIEILQGSLSKYRKGFDELSEETKEEVTAIAQVMQQNLSRWSADEAEDQEEEEEEEEEKSEEEDVMNQVPDSEEEEDY